ncbi:MAG TPA: hypothetical protein VK846_16055 [Candidatus Limnocylindria bacterium]|nr:hypothetical protein [Candidatus Limnocylindria bacterium]
MAVLDFILNCVCLLLWLNWRSSRLTSFSRAPGIALVGTLRRAGAATRERWSSPLVLLAILLVRPIVYSQLGAAAHWTPQFSLGAFVLHFRSDLFTRMLIFSLLNFLLFLAVLYFSLLLIAAVNRNVRTTDPWIHLVRAHLGILSRCPAWLCLLLPFLITFMLWLTLGPLLAAVQIHLPLKSFQQLCAQAAVIGVGGWLLWQYIIALVLVLHVVSSYVYLGNARWWKFINTTASNLLRPLNWRPLRLGKLDCTPLLALALLVVIILLAPRGLVILHNRFAA